MPAANPGEIVAQGVGVVVAREADLLDAGVKIAAHVHHRKIRRVGVEVVGEAEFLQVAQRDLGRVIVVREIAVAQKRAVLIFEGDRVAVQVTPAEFRVRLHGAVLELRQVAAGAGAGLPGHENTSAQLVLAASEHSGPRAPESASDCCCSAAGRGTFPGHPGPAARTRG